MTQYSRRQVLKMVGLVSGACAAGSFWAWPRLNAAPLATPGALSNDFLQVSRLLTQRDNLNAGVASALLLAFADADKGFGDKLAQLAKLLQDQPELLQQERLAFPAEQVASEKLAKTILASWCSGVVGKGNQARYVTYINTLPNQWVSHKLVPPSYSYGPCGSWAKQA
ncbi:sugar dehydrogenase complex small subunit [Herbaspirillum sp. NPDC087042]|uniref:sugar dehydrogenase complex small subunit n=1 Tax=Herbaspirillum sp. NPDC087042 TaxID=3364004 RepID=UPI0037FFD4BB